MSSQIRRLPRGVVVVGVLAALVVSVIVALAVFGRLQDGRVLRGVSAAGVSLGGLTPQAAAAALAAELPATAGDVVLRDPTDGRTWNRSPRELGLSLDAASLADAAMAVGRDGNAITRFWAPLVVLVLGRDLLAEPPFDEVQARATLEELAPEVDVAPEDAGFTLVDGVMQARPPVYGRQLDVPATLALLPGLATAPERATIDIAVITTAPRVYDVGSVTEAYERITSRPLTLNYQGREVATVSVETLLSWTDVTTTTTPEGDEVPAITLDEASIRRFLDPFASDINRPPSNVRLRFGDAGVVEVLEPALPGLWLNVAASADSLIRGAYTEQRVAELAVDTVGPDVRDDKAVALSGKSRALSEAYTTIAGAPEGRVRNMLAAAQRLDGQSVAPGKTFSLSDALGAVTADTGYDMAQVTAAAPGTTEYHGGLEQVATTAFRSAVWSGLPIDMRVAPETRVAWAEPPIGLDAAVGPASIDLRFTNDTDDVVFFGVAIDAVRQAFVWTVYGVPTERVVELVGPTVTNLTPAPEGPRSAPTGLKAPGEREQAIWARGGADVVVERVVTSGGAVIRHDTFRSTYMATPDVVLVGAESG